MKTSFLKSLMVLSLFSLFISYSLHAKPSDYEQKWREVREMEQQGKPQSAIKIVNDIFQMALEENHQPQMLKSVEYGIRLSSRFAEDYQLKGVEIIDQKMQYFAPLSKMVLHALKADLYSSYYTSRRHIILDRTLSPNQGRPKDIRTWDQSHFAEAIFDEFKASLVDPGLLQSTPAIEFADILMEDDSLDRFRPTLYDILAHNALDFYKNDELMASRPAIRFEIDDPQMLDIAGSFIKLVLEKKEAFSTKYHALKLYQEMIAFHINDKDPAALVDLDLDRLSFVMMHASFENKQQTYLHSLEQMETRYIGNEAVSEVYHKLAEYYVYSSSKYQPLISDEHQRDLIIAAQYCENAIKEFPEAYGTQLCKSLLRQIKQKSLITNLDYANLPGQHILTSVAFKNVSTLYIRVIPIDPLEDRIYRRNHRTEELIDRYRSIRPDKQWSVELPLENDYHQHRTELAIPPLPEGFYGLMISDDPSFEYKNSIRCFNNFWVSNISYISHKDNNTDREFYILDRKHGMPLAGISIKAYEEKYEQSTRTYQLTKHGTYTSGSDGSFTIPLEDAKNKRLTLEFSSETDRFITPSPIHTSEPYKPTKREKNKSFFFTDRSIYRPGQTVYFKSILLKQKGDKYDIREGEATSIQFFDANHQAIADLELQSNEYGSVSGSFTIPQGGLTGHMRIGNKSGSVSFRVEEYKRPGFDVRFDPITGSYRLGSDIEISGKAIAYSGNAIDHATVKYRVVRNTYYPFRDVFRGYYPGPGKTAEISSGELETDESGAFKIIFTAIPDKDSDYQLTPAFHYTIYTDITDISGETQSGITRVMVSEKSLIIKLDIPEIINADKDHSFGLTSSNLNGEPEPVDIEVVISRLQSPDRIFKDRPWARPDVYLIEKKDFSSLFPAYAYSNENEAYNWKNLETPYNETIRTTKESKLDINDLSQWKPGEYVIELKTKDAFGEEVSLTKYFTLFSGSSSKMPAEKASLLVEKQATAEPGDTLTYYLGTSYKNVRVLYEIHNISEIRKHEWIQLNDELIQLKVPVREEDRGGLALSLSYVYDNESFNHMVEVGVPFTNKELDLSFESFRDKLIPGQEEEWKIKIRSHKGEKVAAELLAGMYDASLDDIAYHRWSFKVFNKRYYPRYWDLEHAFIRANSWLSGPPVHYNYNKPRQYNHLIWENKYRWGGIEPRYKSYTDPSISAMAMDGEAGNVRGARAEGFNYIDGMPDESNANPPTLPADILSQNPPANEGGDEIIKIRKDLQETAFFFPELKTNEDGDVILSFTAPESLTRWKMMGLAYTRNLEIGDITKELVTQKDLMVMPNQPRFFREGDEVWFTARVVNLSENELSGKAKLHLFDAASMKPVDSIFGNIETEKMFTTIKGNTALVSWKLNIPDNIGPVIYRITASAGNFSDGEEMMIPVLKNRMLVTESMPLAINGKESKNFVFNKLAQGVGQSNTLSHYAYTLEFSSNPAWYAVQALPYLMEYPYECSEQIFNSIYANGMASHIIEKQPLIKNVFDSWKQDTPEALLSKLEKNQDLKNALLEETPWLMQARNESERKNRIALLFNLNNMGNELRSSILKLKQNQLGNGGWPWFKGGRENSYVTQYIITGFGKLMKMGVLDKDNKDIINMLRNGIRYMDEQMFERYSRIKNEYDDHLKSKHLDPAMIQYLYARSFFLEDYYLLEKHEEGFRYFKKQAKDHWLDYDKFLQGMIAISLNKMDEEESARLIVASIKEHALYDDEMGMFWRKEAGYRWYETPIETQALIIEAFDEILNDEVSVELMKIWLLKQKQTQDWETSKATADACYVLLLNGSNLIAEEGDVSIKVGEELIQPDKIDGVSSEAGTGYFRHQWEENEITADMANISVTKSNDGIAWGAVYWQYFEDLDKITAHESPLSITKGLYIKKNTGEGPVLAIVRNGDVLNIGDKLVSRVEIRVDRDMEFVHLKDMRAAALEPENQISGYRWQGGLGYYESIRDASISFFFSYLPKGTWVFEHTYKVTQKGEFSNGISTIQCMYAPEFASHSAGVKIIVE